MSRPIRSLLENTTSEVPRGPLGFFGEGNAVGAVSYFGASLVNKFNPIAGTSVGYRVKSHSVEETEDGELHTLTVTSYLEQTARFIGKFRSPPTNIDFFTDETEVVSVKPLKERNTANTWQVKVLVEPRLENNQ